MTMLHLRPETADGLTALAAARGLSIEEYVQQLIERELASNTPASHPPSEGSGMVWEDGLFIYGAGTALPTAFIDNAIRHSREERSVQLLGDDS